MSPYAPLLRTVRACTIKVLVLDLDADTTRITRNKA